MEATHFLTIGLPEQLDKALTGPYLQGHAEPRFGFIGRSNVGKSSLINAILERKSLAYTSSTPGKTRVLNFYHDPRAKVVWVDCPGYGHAKVSRSERSGWEKLIEKYVKEDPELRLLLVLIDSRTGPTPLDLEAIQYFSSIGANLAFIFTKWDAVRTQSEKIKMKRESVRRLQSIGIQIKSEDEVFWVSVKDRTGIQQLRKAIALCRDKSS